MERVKNRINKWSIAGFAVILFLVFSIFSTTAKAASEPIVIKDFNDLFVFAQASQGYDYQGKTIVLENDIEITEIDQAMLDKYGIKHLTIGNKDLPFKGTFDGQGHTIRGLKYDTYIIKDANSGLFSFIENATIQNLIVEDADLDCIFQGGVVVGHAQSSTLKNITVLNSKLHISPANNVVSLVTNGGFSGGGIAGIIEDTMMYNCEVSGTEIVNNSTSAITGVGGEGLYMGGLVGWASGSNIEYCRARANYTGESENKELKNTIVRNDYDVVVGALGGKSVYAGGIVGGVNHGTSIIDCFSTAEVSFDVANYVAVGSGIAGYAGGITGALRGESQINRCHYAGNIYSKQYNAILVIPIIQHNVNINGITRIREDNSLVMNSYFKPSAIKSGVSISAVGGEDDNITRGAKDDKTYTDIEFWEGQDYDFIGNKNRNSIQNNTEHYNKWVMDYDLGIPVHGSSVMATFDFPNVGKVSMNETALVHKKVETSDPLNFAIQGIHPREKQQVTLEMTLEDNENYRLTGWYKKTLVEEHRLPDMQKLLEITTNEELKVNQGISPITLSIQDRDLFVAGIEGKVTFHELDGSIINPYWHKYDTKLEDVKPNLIEGSVFYGWTTIPKQEGDKTVGYSAITSTELNDIKQKGELYKAGDAVKKAMQLYPIFINSSANVITEFEGHEQDGVDDITRREGVGRTTVSTEGEEVYIDVVAEDGSKNFPEGYQFRGWYKKLDDGNEVCVTREYRYKVSDISEKVTYVARFNYAVEYYTRAFDSSQGNDYTKSDLHATVMHTYQEDLKNIDGPAYALEEVIGWGTEHVNHGDSRECVDGYKEKITAPLSVYSHNTVHTGDGGWDNYSVRMRTDFPDSGVINSSKDGVIGKFTYEYEEKENYNFQFWTLERDIEQWTYSANPMNTGLLSNLANYEGHALVSADVKFHGVPEEVKTVQRRYKDSIFMNEVESEVPYQYQYPVYGGAVAKKTEEGTEITGELIRESSPSNQDMQELKDGYQFLGWISEDEVSAYEWDYIYDVEGEAYCTSDIEKAEPYLLKEYSGEDEHSNYWEDRLKVQKTMDLYPVYAKFDVTTTTNIHEIYGDKIPNEINVPNKPTANIQPGDSVGKSTVTVVAENEKTNILKNADENNAKKYKLTSLLCEVDGQRQELEFSMNDEGDCVYTGEITAGKPYKFIAVYSPAIVSYHMNDNDNIQIEVRDIGGKLGASPLPDFEHISDGNQFYFAGWTQQKPDEGIVWKFATKDEYDAANLQLVSGDYVVKESINLWPVLVKAGITVNSNIDEIISAAGEKLEDYRKLGRNSAGDLQLEAKDYQGYVFDGWYTDYVDENNSGTKVSDADIVKLSPEQLFEAKTYTAVFKQAVAVTYHDCEGKPLYTVNVESGTRSFVEEIKDAEGNVIGEVAIDTEPIVKLSEMLKGNEKFHEWQLKSESGDKMISWEEFKKDLIDKNMDIYPSIVRVTSTDSNDADCTDALEYFVTSENDEPLLSGLFKEQYAQPNLTLHVEQQTWNPADSTKNIISIEGLSTRVYSKTVNDDGSIKYVEASQGPVVTDAYGNALHEFFGKLILKKEYDDKSINGLVYFNIANVSGEDTRTIPVEVKDGIGILTVNLPVGEYKVEEDSNWSWRDEVVSVSQVDEQNSLLLQAGEEKEVTVKNQRVNEKWFADESREKNIFREKNISK